MVTGLDITHNKIGSFAVKVPCANFRLQNLSEEVSKLKR